MYERNRNSVDKVCIDPVVVSRRRRNAICLNKVIDHTDRTSMVCQICNEVNGMFTCVLCKRLVCMHDSIRIHTIPYCSVCLVDPDSSPFILSAHEHENKRTYYMQCKQQFLYIISFGWIKKRKVEPICT